MREIRCCKKENIKKITVKKIVANYLKQNGYDGLHDHATNQNYAGCGCGLKNMFVAIHCSGCTGTCEPAYKHTIKECKKCSNYLKCEPWDVFDKKTPFIYCGKKK